MPPPASEATEASEGTADASSVAEPKAGPVAEPKAPEPVDKALMPNPPSTVAPPVVTKAAPEISKAKAASGVPLTKAKAKAKVPP